MRYCGRFHQNNEEDFVLWFKFKNFRPTHPWVLVFHTTKHDQYIASFDGERYINAQPETANADYMRIEFKNHDLACGVLCYTLFEDTPDAFFSDGRRKRVLPIEMPFELWRGASDDEPLTPEFEVVTKNAVRGFSAYEVAVQNGFEGTESEWLEHLRATANIQQSTGGSTTDAISQKGATELAAVTLSEARKHTDEQTAATLSEANTYTDTKISDIPTPDVSGQILKHNTSELAHADLRQAVATKVTKESGKGLSEEDFTTLLRQKLAGLENYDDTQIFEDVEALQRRLVEGLAAKQNTVPGKGLSTNDYTALDKAEVAKVATKEPAQILETITGSVASLNVLGGHTYNCGELTSLTFASVEDSPRESVVFFKSGATATTVFYPNGLTVVGYSRPEPNKSYEISIRASRAIIVSAQ